LGVQIRLNSPVTQLILENEAIVGVEVGGPGGAETIRARAGVILASGDGLGWAFTSGRLAAQNAAGKLRDNLLPV
jgi:hypothetical protein